MFQMRKKTNKGEFHMIQTIAFDRCTDQQKDNAFNAIFSVNGDKIKVTHDNAAAHSIRRRIRWNFLLRKDV